MRRVCLLLVLLASPALARVLPAEPLPPSAQCEAGIAAAEASERLPPLLLGAIARVESGRPDPATGRVRPWPWTIDVAGIGTTFATKDQAVAAVAALQALGVHSIDVGCLQVNLYFHPHAFASLDEAFDPVANAAYGARFLASLHAALGNWPQAAAAYHSQTPALAGPYETRVLATWPLASRYPDPGRPAAAGGPDYSRYTPEFAAQVRQMDEDRARLEARFGAPTAPAAAAPRHGRRPQVIAGLMAPVAGPWP